MSKLFYKVALASWLACATHVTAIGQTANANWTSDDQPCGKYADLVKYTLGDIGVKIDVSDPWASAFRQALTFWNHVLDANLHEENNINACAVRVIYGGPDILGPDTSEDSTLAAAQVTDFGNFRGKIAVVKQAASSLSAEERFWTAVHEFGHMFGLYHNANTKSVMRAEDFDSTQSLDTQDLASLRKRHQLRVSTLEPILASCSESSVITATNRREMARLTTAATKLVHH